MIRKAAVKLTDKYVFTLDISVDSVFCEEPWSTLGKKAVLKTKTKTIGKTRKLANSSPDTLSTLSQRVS